MCLLITGYTQVVHFGLSRHYSSIYIYMLPTCISSAATNTFCLAMLKDQMPRSSPRKFARSVFVVFEFSAAVGSAVACEILWHVEIYFIISTARRTAATTAAEVAEK